jgi:hypothetical protein
LPAHDALSFTAGEAAGASSKCKQVVTTPAVEHACPLVNLVITNAIAGGTWQLVPALSQLLLASSNSSRQLLNTAIAEHCNWAAHNVT